MKINRKFAISVFELRERNKYAALRVKHEEEEHNRVPHERMSDPHKVLSDKLYKGWAKCVWVKCIKGIGTYVTVDKKKSAFDKAGAPDLKEDNIKITVMKTNPNYHIMFPVFSLFSELQRYTASSISPFAILYFSFM